MSSFFGGGGGERAGAYSCLETSGAGGGGEGVMGSRCPAGAGVFCLQLPHSKCQRGHFTPAIGRLTQDVPRAASGAWCCRASQFHPLPFCPNFFFFLASRAQTLLALQQSHLLCQTAHLTHHVTLLGYCLGHRFCALGDQHRRGGG